MAEQPYCDIMAGKLGFSSKPMIPPPSERSIKTIQLELTTGCSHGRCTFCDMYGGPENYSEKSLEEFREHTDSVIGLVSRAASPKRIFIGTGNALAVKTDKLEESICYAEKVFKEKTGSTPRRISLYGNTNNILKQNYEGMRTLRESGLNVVYWGIESGSDEVLKISGKGFCHNQACRASNILRQADIFTSAMIMPGLGGIKYFNEHVSRTVELLNYCRPYWITFMGLKIKPGTPYETWMKRQKEMGVNRELTPQETAEQTAKMIEQINFDVSVGVHGENIHDSFCFNPVTIGSKKTYSDGSPSQLADLIRSVSERKFRISPLKRFFISLKK